MGGPGSGRQKDRQRRTVETCRELDANQLSAAGYIQPHMLGCESASNFDPSRSRSKYLAQFLNLPFSWNPIDVQG
jgi:hypothetical protein